MVGEGTKEAAWAAVGSRPGRTQLLLTTAALVGAVNALLVGLGVTLLTGLAVGSTALAVAVGVVVALAVFGMQFAYINHRSVSLRR